LQSGTYRTLLGCSVERRREFQEEEEIADVASASVVGVELQARNDTLLCSSHRRTAR